MRIDAGNQTGLPKTVSMFQLLCQGKHVIVEYWDLQFVLIAFWCDCTLCKRRTCARRTSLVSSTRSVCQLGTIVQEKNSIHKFGGLTIEIRDETLIRTLFQNNTASNIKKRIKLFDE